MATSAPADVRTRASATAPCPVCNSGTKGCSTTDDGQHFCRGDAVDPSAWGDLLKGKTDAAGFRHYRRAAEKPNRAKGRRVKPADGWEEKARGFASLLRPQDRDDLAARLGLPADVLAHMPLVGLSQATGGGAVYSLPECDGAGRVVGIQERFPDGAKRTIEGGRRGLALVTGWRDRYGPVFVVEGASDTLALTATGLAAVGRPSNMGGTEHLVELFRDLPAERVLVVVGENDPKPNGDWPGRAGAVQVAKALAGKLGRRVLWTLPPAGAKDVRAWLTDPARAALGWTERGEQLLAELMAGPTAAEPTTGDIADGPDGSSPVILVTAELHRMAKDVRAVLAGVPGIYSRGNVLVEEVPNTPGRLRPVSADALPELLDQHMQFWTDEKRVFPQPNVCKAVFSSPIAPIREVAAVVGYPTLLPSGRILADAGYDPKSRILVADPGAVAVEVPDTPTAADARRAAGVLLDVFREFPFPPGADGERSRSAVLALVLTLLARPLIAGPTPLFLVQKNVPAAGGSLVIKAAWRIVTGTDLPMVSYSHDEEESRKLLTSLVLDGRPAAALDNIDGEFGTPSLCRFITSERWSDRVMRLSKVMDAPNWMTLFGSANNAVLMREMPRRTVIIDLHTDDPNPELVPKQRPNLLKHIDACRGELLSAAFTILKAWLSAGRPQPAGLPHFGSFEAWSSTIRAALVFAGQADPYTPAASRDDQRRRQLRAVAAGLRELDPNGDGLTAAQIVKRLDAAGYQCRAVEDMADALAEIGEKLTAVSVGKILAGAKGRNLGGIRIVEAGHHRTNLARWTAETVELSPATPAMVLTTEQSVAGVAGDKSWGGHSPSGETDSAAPPPAAVWEDPIRFYRLMESRGLRWPDVIHRLNAEHAAGYPPGTVFHAVSTEHRAAAVDWLTSRPVAA